MRIEDAKECMVVRFTKGAPKHSGELVRIVGRPAPVVLVQFDDGSTTGAMLKNLEPVDAVTLLGRAK